MLTTKLFSGLTVIIFAVVIILLFWNLGDNHLSNWDEAWYAAVSRTMFETGNFFTPMWNTRPFLEKPPLYFWLTGIAYTIFGVNEFSARFFSAFSSLGSIILVYWLAKKLWGQSAGLISAIVLTSTIGFLYRARTGNMDNLLAFLMLVGVVTFFEWHKTNKQKWLILLGLTIGAGFLTKGLQIFLFPIIAGLYLLITDLKKLSNYWLSIFIGLIIVVCWMTLSYLINGQEFLDQFLIHQVDKFGSGSNIFSNFSLDYFLYLKSGLKLWFIFFIPVVIDSLCNLKKIEQRLLILFLISFLTLFSFSENKSTWYLVPLYPVIALLIGSSMSLFKNINIKFNALLLFVFMLIAIGQLVIYKHEYFTPNVSGDEAKVALAAQQLMEKNNPIHLTHYYAPTTVYYSQRLTYAVYSEHKENGGWWIKPKSDWNLLLKKPEVIIITTILDLEYLKFTYPEVKFSTLFTSGEKLLIKTL